MAYARSCLSVNGLAKSTCLEPGTTPVPTSLSLSETLRKACEARTSLVRVNLLTWPKTWKKGQGPGQGGPQWGQPLPDGKQEGKERGKNAAPGGAAAILADRLPDPNKEQQGDLEKRAKLGTPYAIYKLAGWLTAHVYGRAGCCANQRLLYMNTANILHTHSSACHAAQCSICKLADQLELQRWGPKEHARLLPVTAALTKPCNIL
jgi:hypothetical protein